MPSAYRGSAPGARQILVGTFEPLRTQYAGNLDPSLVAWQPGEPPEWLAERVSACLVASGIRNARISRWAEEDVAEIHSALARPGELIASPASRITFVGMSPMRHIGNDRVGTRFGALTIALAAMTTVATVSLPFVVAQFGVLGLVINVAASSLSAIGMICVGRFSRRPSRVTAALAHADGVTVRGPAT